MTVNSGQDGDSLSILKRRLEHDSAVIYMLDRSLCITYCNWAWDYFAESNQAESERREFQMGRSVLEVIPGVLRPFFEERYRTVMESGKPFEHDYECSSAELYRVFRMRAYPLPKEDGLVVVNSLVIERPHDPERKVLAPRDGQWSRPDGTVEMCCHCRRTRRISQPDVWDWVPLHIAEPPERISHGMCNVCLNLYYPRFVTEAPGGSA